MYHGTQHGTEPTGAMVAADVAHHLLTNHDVDPAVESLVNNVQLFLLPIMNAAGHESPRRYDANDVVLGRNWGGPGTGQGWNVGAAKQADSQRKGSVSLESRGLMR